MIEIAMKVALVLIGLSALATGFFAALYSFFLFNEGEPGYGILFVILTLILAALGALIISSWGLIDG